MESILDGFREDIISVKKKNKTKQYQIIDIDEKETINTEHYKEEIVRTDRGKFFKVFHKAEKQYMSLSFPAMKMLNYISFRLLEGQYEVGFEPEEVMEVCNWKSKAVFYKALRELVDTKFLFKHKTRGLHYINPAYFFNGRRERLVRYEFNKPMVVHGQKVRRMIMVDVMEPSKEGESNERQD